MEQFEKFPGEAYFVGFLRNYAEYLGLDRAYVYSLFRAKMIQTSPVPNQLLKQDKPRIVLPLIILGIVIVLAGLSFVFFDELKGLLIKPDPGNELVESAQTGTVYQLSSVPLKKRVYVGDSIIIYDITIEVSTTLSALALKTPTGEHFIELGEEAELDVDGTGGADIIVFLSDISSTDITRGAEISVLLKNSQNTVQFDSDAGSAERGGAVSAIILDDNRAYPFTLRVTFRDTCIFRYQADNQARVEDLYSNAQLVTIQANNGIRLWLSNDNAARMQIIADSQTFDLAANTANRVMVLDIRWVRNGARYQLAVLEVD
jgi:cytoskeletal protein RodZ